MKKKVFGRKLSRNRASRNALFRGLMQSLILNGTIITTKAKAKAIQPSVEKLVTLAKKASVDSTRRVYAALANDGDSTDRMVKVIAPEMNDRPGGYTRLVSLPPRNGDKAPMARLSWVKEIVVPTFEKPAKKEKKDSKVQKTEETKKATLKKKVVAKKASSKAGKK